MLESTLLDPFGIKRAVNDLVDFAETGTPSTSSAR